MKCINYVKSYELSSSSIELNTKQELNVNSILEAETHITEIDISEGLADSIDDEKLNHLCEAIVEKKQSSELAVEVEIVELSTSVKETLQFPEIEEIIDSGKSSEIGCCEVD